MPLDLNDPEVKAALKQAAEDAAAAAKAAADESIEKLAANNAKLTKQLKEAKAGEQIDPVEHAKLEEQVGTLQSQLDKVTADSKKSIDALTKQIEVATASVTKETAFTQKLLRDNGLSDALVKIGVEPAFLPAVKALLRDQVQIVADGENRVAKVGDKDLTAYVSEWAQTPEGKHYVKAPENSGGGTSGTNNAGGGVKTVKASDSIAFGANLADIATGKVKVETPS